MPQNKSPQALGAQEAAAVVCGYAGQNMQPDKSWLAVEAPLNIAYGGVPFAVMMTTPCDLEDFVTGFSITEGVIEKPDDIRGLQFEQVEGGMKAHVTLAAGQMQAHLARSRTMAGRTGCGVCGIADIEALPRRKAAVESRQRLTLDAIHRASTAINAAQPLGALTHAMHAAAWCTPSGEIVLVREDAGRHNALDKLIGALAKMGESPQAGFVLITSRASFEMVEKTAVFGASCLVAISAPTSLAVERAKELGVTLAGVARHDGVILYSGADAILPGEGQ